MLESRKLLTRWILSFTVGHFAISAELAPRSHKQYPNYTVVQRQINRNPEKKTYCGLTYKYMEDYINTHGTKEERKANLEEFKEKTLISKCHGKAFRYPVIKQ